MADTVAHAKVVYQGDDQGFQKASKRVNASAGATIKKFRNVALAATAVTAAMAGFIKSQLSIAEKLSDAAKKANANVEALQKLRFAADQNGASTRDMDDALTRLTRRMSLFAVDGGGPAAKAIEALGINVKTATGDLRDSSEVFDEIVGKFGQLTTSAGKAALASQLFGEDAGPRLLPLLNQGTAALREYGDEAQRMGQVLTTAGVEKAAAANVKLRALGNTIRTQLTTAVVENSDKILLLATDMEAVWVPAIIKVGGWLTSLVSTITMVASKVSGLIGKFNELAKKTAEQPSRGFAGGLPGLIGGLMTDRPDAVTPEGDPMSPDGGDGSGEGMNPFVFPEELSTTWLDKYQEFMENRAGITRAGTGKIASIEKKSQDDQVKTFGGFLDVMANTSIGKHQKLFKAVADIAGKEGLINTYKAATDVLADKTVPFWGKAAAVASVIGMGLNLVNSIKGASSGGGGGGAPSMPGGNAGAVPNQGGGDSQMININLTGSRRESVLEFIELFNEAREDGALFSVNGAA